MKHIFFLLSLGVALLFGSCATTNYISFDVLAPAAITLFSKTDGQNVVIVDNASDWNILAKESDGVTPSELDSAKASLLYSLVEFMNEEEYFNNVSIYPYKMYDTQKVDLGSVRLLTKKEVANICKESDANVLISLDEFLLAGSVDTPTGWLPMLNLKIGLAMRIYSPVTGEMIHPQIVHTDSLYSLDYGYRKGTEKAEVEAAVKQITVVTADKLVKTFSPHWGTEERWYYSDGTKRMKEAAKLISQNKWKEASTIWEELFVIEANEAKKAKLASNIALANEATDNLSNALVWITKAFDLLPSKSGSEYALEIVAYKGVLEVRNANIIKLKEQYGDD